MENIERKNKVVLFYSPQGGAGKSTIAVNTAIFFAKQGIKTLLVDMAIYGSLASALRIPQKGGTGVSSVITLLDLDIKSANSSKFCEVLKNSIVNNVVVDSLDVLTGGNPIKMEAVNETYAQAIVRGLKSLNYDVIIVDTSSELSEKNIIFLEVADFVMLPVIQDINCGWKIVLFREIMERYLLDKDKFALIINKCNKYSGFNNLEFENEVGYKVVTEIPLFTKRFQNYINQGLNINSMSNRKAYKAFLSAAQSILNSVGQVQ